MKANRLLYKLTASFMAAILMMIMLVFDVQSVYAMPEDINLEETIELSLQEEPATVAETTENSSEEILEEPAAEQETSAEEEPVTEEQMTEADEKSEEVEKPELTLSETVGDYAVTMYAPEGIFSSDAILMAKEIVTTSEIQNAVEDEIGETQEIHSFDISVISGGEEMHELDGRVQITFSNVELASDETASVIYVDDAAQNAEVMSAGAQDSEVSFSTTHFSNYNVVITKAPANTEIIAFSMTRESRAKIAMGCSSQDITVNAIEYSNAGSVNAYVRDEDGKSILDIETLKEIGDTSIIVNYTKNATGEAVKQIYQICVVPSSAYSFEEFADYMKQAVYNSLTSKIYSERIGFSTGCDSTVPEGSQYGNCVKVQNKLQELGVDYSNCTWRLEKSASKGNGISTTYTFYWANMDITLLNEETKDMIRNGSLELYVSCKKCTFIPKDSGINQDVSETMKKVTAQDVENFMIFGDSNKMESVVEAPDTYTVKYILADGLGAQGYELTLPYNDVTNGSYTYTTECGEKIDEFKAFLSKAGSINQNVIMTLANDVTGVQGTEEVTYKAGTVISISKESLAHVNVTDGGAGNGFAETIWNPGTVMTIIVSLPPVQNAVMETPATNSTDDTDETTTPAPVVQPQVRQIENTQVQQAPTADNTVAANANAIQPQDNNQVITLDEEAVPMAEAPQAADDKAEQITIEDENVPMAAAPASCIWHFILFILTILYAGYSIYTAVQKNKIIRESVR